MNEHEDYLMNESQNTQPQSAGAATPSEQLRQELMDYHEPKNEREWCAVREIEDLLKFVRAQMQKWDQDADGGVQRYNHGKQILARYEPPITP